MTLPATRTDQATLTLDLKTMITAETPFSEWAANTEWLLGRELSDNERRHLIHALNLYKREPWSRLARDEVRRVARLLVVAS